MGDIIIKVADLGTNAEGNITYYGYCRCTGMEAAEANIQWSVDLPTDTLAATINSAIKDAAIASAEALQYSVGALDKKTLVGGAVGL